MNQQEIRVGLIGLGGMANAHRKMIAESNRLRLVALCDVNIDLLNKVGDEENIKQVKRYNDMEELIRDLEVDAVISIVPNNLHARVLQLCIQHKKPVMAEKPFTLNFEEAQNLVSLYELQPIPCMVGFSYRYIPSFRYAKHLLENNKLGTIRHIEVKYLQQFGAPLFQTPYLWRFNKKVTGTGALGDLGAHMIDSTRFFVGEFVSVSAMMKTFINNRKDPSDGVLKEVDVDDYACFQAILENDILGNFITTRNAVGSGNQHEVTIYGDLGTIHVNCECPDVIDLCIKDQNGKIEFNKVKVPDTYRKGQLEDFADLVMNKAQIGTPQFYDGYQNQKVIEGIIKSAESGQIVHFTKNGL